MPLLLALTLHYPLVDDANISLTFAKSLARGDGFVYNHPPAIQGTTTPLFTLLLAAAGELFPNIPLDAIAVGPSILFATLSAWIMFIRAPVWGLTSWEAVVVASVAVTTAYTPWVGMEFPLFALLLLLAIDRRTSARPLQAGCFAGLLTLVRGEGILLTWLLALEIHWERRWRYAVLLCTALALSLSLVPDRGRGLAGWRADLGWARAQKGDARPPFR